ncbi:hypothetical protein O181_123598 [Austropuccinia psidii MF-1]|uniref:Uncharacterized protein n=1 Tax=Austropuccinia psidii MF-1 TaxID=1389203 RepID=A0A9Q3KM11_9BASI|nr:hypothetical protein [Austropuccinia psidii MF-1]
MSFENDKYSVDKDPYEWCPRQSKRLKAINTQMNIHMSNHKLLTQMPGELEHAVKCRCNHNCTLDDIENTLQDVRKRTNIGCSLKTNTEKGWQKWKRRKIIFATVVQQTIMPTTVQRKREKSMPLRTSQGRNPQTQDSEPDSMVDAIREQSDDDQDPRGEFLVEYQEETPLEIQYI